MWRNRNLILLWLVDSATALGIELFSVTILVAVFEQTDSTLQAAGVMVARMLPAFLLGPLAGVLVDRFPRKNVLISMDVVRLLLIVVAMWLLNQNDAVPVGQHLPDPGGTIRGRRFSSPGPSVVDPIHRADWAIGQGQ
ncbi:MAG: MFS transporter [Caldilineaceae bacterium]|nr:MFS transporter [Caldilineaceae bacterium]